MPIVRVNMFEGRSLDKKRHMVREITRIVADVCEVSEDGVHVLIEEVSRDDWGRGGILHRDRGPRAIDPPAVTGTSFRSIARVVVESSGIDEYLSYRRDHVNPAMATMPGFRGTLTLADINQEGSFLIINNWDEEAAWRGYQGTQIHDALRDKIRGELVKEMSIERYTTMDLPSSQALDAPDAPHRYLTVSTHRVKTGESDVYLKLRETSVHPSMADFEGFVSSNAMASLDEPYAFLIVNSWTSREAAGAYSHSPAHYWLRDQVRAILSEHSGTRHYEVVAV